MPSNSLDFNGFRSDQLKALCQQVTKIKETPELINLVATNTEYLNYCRKIIRANVQNRKSFASFCRHYGLNPKKIQNRLSLVATVLGLNKQSDFCGQGDFYRILGVTPNADDNTIKQAYRKKAQLLHPDKHNGDKGSSEEFIELNAAYSHLRDPDLRNIYHVTTAPVSGQTRSIEEDSAPAPSRPRPAVGRFISLMCVLIGCLVIITYSYETYDQSQSSVFVPQQNTKSLLRTPITTNLMAEKETAASTEPMNSMVDETGLSPGDQVYLTDQTPVALDESAIEAVYDNNLTFDIENSVMMKQSDIKQNKANDTSSAAMHAKIPKPRMTTFSTKAGATIGDIAAKKAASTKIIETFFEFNNLSLSKAPVDHDLTISAARKKTPPPVFGEGSDDIDTVPEDQKHQFIQPDTEKMKMDEEGVFLPQIQRVLSFLDGYMRTYEEKDLEKFKTFFDSNALEQGQPFESQLQKHQKAFDSVKSLKYNIELKSITVEKGTDTDKIIVEGAFTAQHQYTENSWSYNTGSIRLELWDAQDGLLVSKMDYEMRR